MSVEQDLERAPVLVVDDTLSNRLSFEALLERVGVEAVCCESGARALEAALHSDFALAIIDVQMPEMDGYELARYLRRAKRTRDLPLVFVTATSRSIEHIHKGYAAGAVDYVVKPFPPEVLEAKVQGFVRLFQQRRALERLTVALESEIARREAMEAELRAHRDRLEREVRRRTESLERSNRALEAFAHSAAHDLQAPLRTVADFADALVEDLEAGHHKDALDDAQRIRRAAVRASHLVSSVMELAQVAGAQPAHDRVPLGEVVADSLDDLAATVRTNGAQISVGELPVVSGDRRLIHRLMLNLLSNALKFVSKERAPRVVVEAEIDDGDACRVRVLDNGVGFDPTHADQMFEPFGRLHGREFDGAGIGLSVCQRIVDAHGGSLSAQPTPGGGATFEFTLPLALAASGAATSA